MSDILFEEIESNCDHKSGATLISSTSTAIAGVQSVLVRAKVRGRVVGEGRASSRLLAKTIASANALELLSLDPLKVQELVEK